MNPLLIASVSALFWTGIYFASKYSFPKVLPGFTKWEKVRRYQAAGLIPSTIFILVSVPMSLWVLLFDNELNQVRVSGSTPMSMATISIAFGYFIYDTLIILNHLKVDGPALLTHGVLCLITYGLAAMFEVYHAYGPVFLLFESSTLFVNIRWFLVELGLKESRLYVINGLLLVAVFGGVRIVYGLAASASFWADTYAAALSGGLPTPIILWYATSNLSLNGLNIFWFSRILRGALKAARPRASGQPADGQQGQLAR